MSVYPPIRHGRCKFCGADNDKDRHPHIEIKEVDGGCYAYCNNCSARTETRKSQGEAVSCWKGGHYTIPVQSEKEIYEACVDMLHGMVEYVGEWLEYTGLDEYVEDDMRFGITMHATEIVNRLFLCHTTHGGGTSTWAKCYELGIEDPSECIRFTTEEDEASGIRT